MDPASTEAFIRLSEWTSDANRWCLNQSIWGQGSSNTHSALGLFLIFFGLFFLLQIGFTRPAKILSQLLEQMRPQSQSHTPAPSNIPLTQHGQIVCFSL